MSKFTNFFKNRTLIINFSGILHLKCHFRSVGTRRSSAVGFIGLGAMGSHMARNLLKQYKQMYVYDVNEAAKATLAQDGAKLVSHLSELSRADCIISMLPGSQNVLDIYDGPNGLLSKLKSDTLVIDSSTVEPAVPQKLAHLAKNRGVTFLDAPVSGGTLAAKTGRLTFMVGGNNAALRSAEPLLQAMGQNIIYCGDSGCGQVAKLSNNLLLGISMAATAEAMNLGMRLGMDPKLLASVFNSSSGRCWSSETYNPVPGVLTTVPASNSYQGGFKTSLMIKDLSLAESVAQENGVPTPFANYALQMYKAVSEQGKADLDFSIIYQYIKDLEKNNAK